MSKLEFPPVADQVSSPWGELQTRDTPVPGTMIAFTKVESGRLAHVLTGRQVQLKTTAGHEPGTSGIHLLPAG